MYSRRLFDATCTPPLEYASLPATTTHMHQTLHIPEILLNIFGHCYSEPAPGKCCSVDLAVLARTCRTFKEPALDVLWEELHDLSPLARCLPEACYKPKPTGKFIDLLIGPCYSFSRPLKEAEWNTLQGYTCRIRSICSCSGIIDDETITALFTLAPLFPRLRSLYWDSMSLFAPVNVAVPSLTTLHFLHLSVPLPQTVEDFFSAFRDRCPHLEKLVVDVHSSSPTTDSTISDLICRWPQLRRVACSGIALSMDAMSHLSSVSSLESLEFKAEFHVVQEISHQYSRSVFSNLTFLSIRSEFLDTIISLLRHIRLPAVGTLIVGVNEYLSSRAIQSYWAAVQEACLSNVLGYLTLRGSTQLPGNSFDMEEVPWLTLDDLRPCTVFTNLRGLQFDSCWPVSLTDIDLLELASPQMEYLRINYEEGWKTDPDRGGITLSGLVYLLRLCPSLSDLCLAIDTWTFTSIPERLDVSFPPRAQLRINLLDSYILPEFVPDLVSVFRALGLGPPVLTSWYFDSRDEIHSLWDSVLDALRDGS